MNAVDAAGSARLSAAVGPDPERLRRRAGAYSRLLLSAARRRVLNQQLGRFEAAIKAIVDEQIERLQTAADEFDHKDTERRRTTIAPRDLNQKPQPCRDRAGDSGTGERKETRDGVEYVYVCKDLLTWEPGLCKKPLSLAPSLTRPPSNYYSSLSPSPPPPVTNPDPPPPP
ncbi:hypothetical protein THAOC_25666, partial [Thalassiosira oceanica]